MSETQNPASRQGLGFGMVLPTRSNTQDTLSALPKQDAAAWLRRRVPLPIHTARTYAELNFSGVVQ